MTRNKSFDEIIDSVADLKKSLQAEVNTLNSDITRLKAEQEKLQKDVNELISKKSDLVGYLKGEEEKLRKRIDREAKELANEKAIIEYDMAKVRAERKEIESLVERAKANNALSETRLAEAESLKESYLLGIEKVKKIYSLVKDII